MGFGRAEQRGEQRRNRDRGFGRAEQRGNDVGYGVSGDFKLAGFGTSRWRFEVPRGGGKDLEVAGRSSKLLPYGPRGCSWFQDLEVVGLRL
uniref:Uncharacterized protein n=1 Tax=Fagus sylvatica TaxID=28930 RepID=A0A2N9IF94_FAGSY